MIKGLASILLGSCLLACTVTERGLADSDDAEDGASTGFDGETSAPLEDTLGTLLGGEATCDGLIDGVLFEETFDDDVIPGMRSNGFGLEVEEGDLVARAPGRPLLYTTASFVGVIACAVVEVPRTEEQFDDRIGLAIRTPQEGLNLLVSGSMGKSRMFELPADQEQSLILVAEHGLNWTGGRRRFTLAVWRDAGRAYGEVRDEETGEIHVHRGAFLGGEQPGGIHLEFGELSDEVRVETVIAGNPSFGARSVLER